MMGNVVNEKGGCPTNEPVNKTRNDYYSAGKAIQSPTGNSTQTGSPRRTISA